MKDGSTSLRRFTRHGAMLAATVLCFGLLGSAGSCRKFPETGMTTLDGRKTDAAYFAQKNTVVVHYYIGCHAAMLAVRDLQALQKRDSFDFQVLYVAQNTRSHIAHFNYEGDNTWSSIRRHYKMDPIKGDVVAVCESENITEHEGNTVIGEHCDTFAKEIGAKYSPTFLYVDRDMKVRSKDKGYQTVKRLDELESRIRKKFK